MTNKYYIIIKYLVRGANISLIRSFGRCQFFLFLHLGAKCGTGVNPIRRYRYYNTEFRTSDKPNKYFRYDLYEDYEIPMRTDRMRKNIFIIIEHVSAREFEIKDYALC